LHFKSGNSPEIKAVVPLKHFGSTLIAITGNMTSFLAKELCIKHHCGRWSLP
jgi:D-arabinose 5-phosphate isomerase GutQ